MELWLDSSGGSREGHVNTKERLAHGPPWVSEQDWLLGWGANGPLPHCTVLQVILAHKLADARKGFQPGNCFYQIRQPPPPPRSILSLFYHTLMPLFLSLLSLAEFYCVMYLTISHNFFVRVAPFQLLCVERRLLSSSLLLIVCDAILMFASLFRRFVSLSSLLTITFFFTVSPLLSLFLYEYKS